MQRFLRTERLLGKEKFQQLTQKKVVVVGLGAVGSYVVEGLARSGIGYLRLVDFDEIQPTNINRQLYALESTLGQPKADLAKKRVLDINPQCQVEALRIFAHEDTLNQILDGEPDLVVDAIDSLNPKVILLSNCHGRKIPVISSMGAALRTDPSRVQVSDLFQTRYCPLARQVRSRLRRLGITKGIPCVYSDEEVQYEFSSHDEESPEEGKFIRGRKRLILGSLPTLTGIFGLTLAHEALRRLGAL